MARTPLAQHVQDGAAAVGLSRRAFLAGSAATLAAARFARPGRAAASPGTVGVVGAGLAGLTAAYRLKQAGVNAVVYEASSRLGGRCFTGRGAFADGQLYEHGGELIDTGHRELRRLVRELGLELDNLLAAEAKGTDVLGWFDGRPYSFDEMNADFQRVFPQLDADVTAADYPTLYSSYTQRGYELDHMSIAQWIDRYVPGGRASRFGQLLDVAYTIEYAADTEQQSALNLLYLIGYSSPKQLELFGESDEKFHVRGGNDQVVAGLAAALAGQVRTGVALTSIARTAAGRYRLGFDGAPDATFDHVVLALPFSILRDLDYARAGFDRVKTWAIEEQGMGASAKLHVQFDRRFWTGQGSNGETFADTGYQNTWEVTRAQPGRSGILVDFTGGSAVAQFASGSPTAHASRFLGRLEPVLPGASARWNGRATLDYWPGNPWSKGSYSYWKVGQYTRFAGAEGEQSGNCHFAGEHTSIDFQGYLNGAVATGERAASEVLA